MFWVFLASWALLTDRFDTSRQAYLLEAENSVRLAFSSCWQEEAGECIEYELSCERDDYRLRLSVHHEALGFGREVISSAGSRALTAELALNQHQTRVKLQITQVDFWHSEMDEFWGVTLHFDRAADIFDAITTRSALEAAIYVNERPFWLHLNHQPSSDLLAFKGKCLEISPHFQP